MKKHFESAVGGISVWNMRGREVQCTRQVAVQDSLQAPRTPHRPHQLPHDVAPQPSLRGYALNLRVLLQEVVLRGELTEPAGWSLLLPVLACYCPYCAAVFTLPLLECHVDFATWCMTWNVINVTHTTLSRNAGHFLSLNSTLD